MEIVKKSDEGSGVEFAIKSPTSFVSAQCLTRVIPDLCY